MFSNKLWLIILALWVLGERRGLEEAMESAISNALQPPWGMEITLGNDATESQALLFKQLGITSVESYVTWESVEKEKDNWDWSRWDQQVEILKKHGLKWVPFLIVGPAYATPAWFRESEEHVGAVCLEHNIESKIQSIWNPHLRKWIERFLSAFSQRYLKTGVIESVLLGISGDYGEAIFPVWGGGWTFQIPGVYHTHPGYWCGDRYAREAFKKAMRAKYRNINRLNEAWGTSFANFEEVEFPPLIVEGGIREDAPTPSGRFEAKNAQDRRRWLDFVEWYRGEMTKWAEWWIATAKRYFPNTEIYLCTGGDAVPPHGSDFSAQCKVAGKHKAGVRITNEGSDYAFNFYLTRWIASAGKFYKAYYGFEPAAGVDEKGIVARIYNVVASGAKQLHEYIPNITSSEERMKIFRENYQFLERAVPQVEVAVFYPKTSLALRWGDFPERVMEVRDIVDVDFVDELMLRDGALRHYKVLLIIAGEYIERSDLEIIKRWVEEGGILISCGVDKMATVEGDTAPYEDLFERGGTRRLGRGKTIALPYAWDKKEELLTSLSHALYQSGCYLPDGKRDGVYATSLSNYILLLNTKNEPVVKNVHLPTGESTSVLMPPHTIRKVSL